MNFSRPMRLACVGLLAMAGAFATWQMVRLPLWSWWPMMMILGWYGALVLLLLPKDTVRRRWLGLSTLAGVLLGLGFPPSWTTWAVLVAWIPLLILDREVFHKGNRPQPGKIFLFSFHAFILWNVITTFWVMNTALVAGIVANFLNAAIMASVMSIIHVVRHRLPERWSVWVLCSFWISFEYLHHFWDISWPWLTLGNSLSQYPWAIQWYEYTGIFGGSLWVLLANYFIWQVASQWKNKTLWPIVRAGFIIVVPVMCSVMIGWNVKESSAAPVGVTVVQPNFEPHYEKFDVPQHEQSRRFLRLSIDHIDPGTRYIVYPETSFEGIRLNTFRENPVIRLFQSLVDSFPQTRLVTGISSFRVLEKDQLHDISYRTHVSSIGDTTFWDIQNSAVQLSPDEEEYQLYFKSKLVPGPEMFPFRDFLFFLEPIVDKLGGSYEGHTKQNDRAVFTGGPLAVAPVICYESIYGDFTGGYVRKGATALFIVTNDGWWDKTPGHVQHLRLGALRAIEHRRPIARSANTGVSCFIDIKGRIINPTRYSETTAIKGLIKPETRITFYTKWGDLIARFAVVAFILFSLAFLFVISRKRRIKTMPMAPSAPNP